LTIRYEDYKIRQAHALNQLVPMPVSFTSATSSAPKPTN